MRKSGRIVEHEMFRLCSLNDLNDIARFIFGVVAAEKSVGECVWRVRGKAHRK